MRIRTAFAVALLLPSVTSAQARRPRIGGGRPQPAPLGPQPEVIARSQAIIRSRLSIETYPMISRVNAPGFSGGRPVSSWTNFGSGTHADYRHTELLSSSLDITTAYMGGPAITETIEAGFRLRPQTWIYRVRPFADLRFGFEHSSDTFGSVTSDLGIGPASPLASGMRYSRGFGGIAGAGMEYALTNSYSLMTAFSAMRTNMSTYRYNFTSIPTVAGDYRMTTYRLTLGLKYNRARTVSLASQKLPSESIH